MTIEKLREIHRSQPFRPFTMHLADGGQLTVTHPESLAYSPSGRTVIVVRPDESSAWVDLLLISRIEVGNGSSRNGRRKRK
jgi:hypothetical protein